MPEPDPTVEEGSGVNKREPGEDEGVGSTFGVRVPASVLAAYHRLPRKRKRFVRAVLRSVLAELVRSAGSMRASAAAVAAVENYNVNINIPVAMVRAEDTGSAELLKERIRELELELREARRLLESYREKLERAARERQAAEARAAQLERAVRDLEAQLKDWWAVKGRVESTLRAWARGELTAEVALHRIAQEAPFYVPELIARRSPSPLT